MPKTRRWGTALAVLQVAHAQAAQFLAAQAVVEESRQDGPVAFAFEGAGRRRFQQRAGLAVAERGRLAFARVGPGAFDPADRIVANRIDFAQVVEKRGDRGELSADRTGGQAAALEVFAPGDQVSASDLAHLFGAFDAGKGGELFDVDAVGAPGVRVVEVGKPTPARAASPPSPGTRRGSAAVPGRCQPPRAVTKPTPDTHHRSCSNLPVR